MRSKEAIVCFGHKLILHICSRNVRIWIQKSIFNFGGNHFHCKQGGWVGASLQQAKVQLPHQHSDYLGSQHTLSPGCWSRADSTWALFKTFTQKCPFFLTNGNSQFTAVSIIWQFCDTCLAVLLRVLLFFSWDKPGFLPIFSLLPAAGPSHWRKSWWKEV